MTTLTSTMDADRIARIFAEIASTAGRVVMEVYATDFEARVKADQSPVSDADERAEEIILERLAKELPGVPVLAEEEAARSDETFTFKSEFILVDPVDGTREFLKRKPDFTVNIALANGDGIVAGCVYAPARKDLYVGGANAYLVEHLEPGAAPEIETRGQRIHTRAYPSEGLTAAVSSSHLDKDTEAFLSRIPVAARNGIGSSLKFCLIARGLADVYPRWGPTMEWDTGAGQAVLQAAGGRVLTPEGGPHIYGKRDKNFRNGPFIAWGRDPL
ncbi:MAG: 3'(2'),5'-bisphosphate nucleotidase CysQ [Hyphomonadaceae bacterium]